MTLALNLKSKVLARHLIGPTQDEIEGSNFQKDARVQNPNQHTRELIKHIIGSNDGSLDLLPHFGSGFTSLIYHCIRNDAYTKFRTAHKVKRLSMVMNENTNCG